MNRDLEGFMLPKHIPYGKVSMCNVTSPFQSRISQSADFSIIERDGEKLPGLIEYIREIPSNATKVYLKEHLEEMYCFKNNIKIFRIRSHENLNIFRSTSKRDVVFQHWSDLRFWHHTFLWKMFPDYFSEPDNGEHLKSFDDFKDDQDRNVVTSQIQACVRLKNTQPESEYLEWVDALIRVDCFQLQIPYKQ